MSTQRNSNPNFEFGRNSNYNVPTIPSRFLTPILQFETTEKSGLNSSRGIFTDGDTGQESILVSKVARLTNDGSQLGPGAYNVINSSKHLATSVKGTVRWGNSKSTRQDHFTKNFTSPEVGPGAYHPKKKIDRSIHNPTIPRAGAKAQS
jgi:hypothetical protein